MISERRLKKWRREAFQDQNPKLILQDSESSTGFLMQRTRELSNRILQLTQELLDQHLMKGGSKQ